MDNVAKAKFIFVTSFGSIEIQGGRPLIDNLTNFANSFKDVSFLDGSISMCVTQVDDYLTLEQVINNLRVVFESGYLTDKPRLLLEYCLKNVQLFYKPKRDDLGNPVVNDNMLSDLTSTQFINITEKIQEDPNFKKIAISPKSYTYALGKF